MLALRPAVLLALFSAAAIAASPGCTPNLAVATDSGLDSQFTDANRDAGDVPRADVPRADVQTDVRNDIVTVDVLTCSAFQMNCGTRCADLQSDANNCGACGVACPQGPHATAFCRQGVCAATCDPGFGECDGQLADGCETDLTTDPDHCGTCPTACPGALNAVAVCNPAGSGSGSCGIQCLPGYGDCDGNTATGCEAPFNTPNNCGGCGMSCTTDPDLLCVGGASTRCTSSCDSATPTNCNSNCVDTNTNPDFCGSCSNPCPRPANARATCNAGACGTQCLPGFADCDSDPLSGCEADLRTDKQHCGGCMTPCETRLNAQATCSGGVCKYACTPGFGDCDNDLNHPQGTQSDGCEQDLSSVRNCRACGVQCTFTCGSGCSNSTTLACTATGCSVTCAGAFSDCDGNPLNGCEAQTGGPGADPDHCGSCSRACPAAPAGMRRTCDNGVCGTM